MSAVLDYILERLKEPNSWRGLVWIITAAGFVLEPEQREAIVTAGMTLAGILGVITKDNAPSKEDIKQLEIKQETKKKPKKKNETKSDPDNVFDD